MIKIVLMLLLAILLMVLSAFLFSGGILLFIWLCILPFRIFDFLVGNKELEIGFVGRGNGLWVNTRKPIYPRPPAPKPMGRKI